MIDREPPTARATRRRLPAEWEAQCAVQLTWPHPNSDWAPYLDAVEATYTEIARRIAEREVILVASADVAHVEGLLRESGVNPDRLRIYPTSSDDTWARDHGPITVSEDNAFVLLDFEFNGWGGKFPAEQDNRVTETLHTAGAFGDTALRRVDFVLEGGSIESDGAGTLLTTSECLLAPTRNGGLSRNEVTGLLREYFGLDRVLWLDHGYLAGDDTDSHIDTLARFCDESTIAYTVCRDAHDEHFDALAAMEQELAAFRTRMGNPYRLVGLPMPSPCYDGSGHRLPATYANFLIINGAVLVPTYGGAEDAEALRVLQGCFPDREIVGVPCRTLIEQHGSLHCVTMQIPMGVLQ